VTGQLSSELRVPGELLIQWWIWFKVQNYQFGNCQIQQGRKLNG
jgi:hypothetical protein